MSTLRSHTMMLFQIIFSKDVGWDLMNKLGNRGIVELIDDNGLKPAFLRPYSNFVKRCDEVDHMISKIITELNENKIPLKLCEEQNAFFEELRKKMKKNIMPERDYLHSIENEINDVFKKMQEYQISIQHSKNKLKHLLEFRAVCATILNGIGNSELSYYLKQIGGKIKENNFESASLKNFDVPLKKITGILDIKNRVMFTKMLFRITRGNHWICFFSKMDPEINNKIKVGFQIIMYYRTPVIYNKIVRMAQAFDAALYEPADTFDELLDQVQTLDGEINEIKSVIKLLTTEKSALLQKYANAEDYNISRIEFLKLFIQKEKIIYTSLNCFRERDAYFYGHLWCPVHNENLLLKTVNDFNQSQIGFAEVLIKTLDPKNYPFLIIPSYLPCNSVTEVFQELVNMYGVPSYKEINPAFFYIISFPYLFGQMFGDVAHCLILLAIALFFFIFKDIKTLSFYKDLRRVRYLLLLMSLFGIYFGFLYNDAASLPVSGNTCYNYNEIDKKLQRIEPCGIGFGIDKWWKLSENSLTFENSLKMKLAIIIGFFHMLLGLFIKGANEVYLKKKINLFCETIPQILFMLLTVGYLVFLIIYKWSTNWATISGYSPPNLITVFISIFIPTNTSINPTLHLYPDTKFESNIHKTIFALSFTVIPIMLILKPAILIYSARKQSHKYDIKNKNEETFELMNMHHQENNHYVKGENPINSHENDLSFEPVPQNEEWSQNEHHTTTEIITEQIIHTIEFVLGTISNTASYLRLWALSLAHQGLSEVFFEFIIKKTYEIESNFAFLFIIPSLVIFFNVTLGIFIFMDMMECILHTLRLHWVEFQNKFYKGEGRKFYKFSFSSLENK